jgi:RNA recognition motif-containing protein
VNIYVGNLPFGTTQEELAEVFSAHGTVAGSSIIIDRETGRSRGFGFVEMPNDDEARRAIEAMNQADFGGRALVVNEARPKEPRSGGGFGGGGGGGRGGYGGGGGGRGGYGGGGGGGGGRGGYGGGGGRGDRGDRGGDRGGGGDRW